MHILIIFTFLSFSFFVPGWAFVEYFFPEFKSYEKLPLYLVLSSLISTLSIWFLSFLFGFISLVIIICYLLFGIFGIFVYFRKKLKFNLNKQQVLMGMLVCILFFVALYPGIFTLHNDYYILSSVNWQDTAMHLGIIESLAQGNFPPQAPYFAGQPLSYYYLVDFQASILVKLIGGPFARSIVYINPVFAASFAVSIWALIYKHSGSKLASGIGSFLSVLIGNLMFTEFLFDWSNSLNFSHALSLLKSRAYTMQYQGLMEMVPMADYFLQNRPMMLALSVVAVILLLVSDFESNFWEKRVLLAAFVNIMLFKFQAFGFAVGLFLIFLSFLANLNNITNKLEFLLKIILINITGLFLYNIFAGGSTQLVRLAVDNFSFSPWVKDKNIFWFFMFAVSNFSPLFFLSFYPVSLLKRKIRLFLLFYLVTLYLIPHTLNFTVYKADMFKFFYFMQIAVVVLSSLVLARLSKLHLGKLIAFLLTSISILTSVLTLTSSILNKNVAYSKTEYQVGLWIRKNTTQNSIFISLPSVHSPITQIGGRQRLLSYITWPYTHGFYVGQDNVFWREGQIKLFYNNPQNLISKKYLRDMNVNYVYVGALEISEFPNALPLLEEDIDYELVFAGGGIYVFTF